MNDVISPRYALEARNLSVTLGGQRIFDLPLFQVKPKEMFAIIGSNGSGKTTLILCLALLLKPERGTISYFGQPVTDGVSIMHLRRRLAVIFQEPLLLRTSVQENIAIGLKMRGVPKNEIKERTMRWLQRFGVDSLLHRQAQMLSGGEAHRVSLARAFSLQPEILFMDEPFSSLDSPTRQTLIEDLKNVLRETQVTTIMVTHDRNEALSLADRVAVLMNKTVQQVGTPREIFTSPINEEVATFVGVENILPGTVRSNSNGIAEVSVNDHIIDAVSDITTGRNVTVCIRPEDITLLAPTIHNGSSSARNHLDGKVSKIFPVGSQMRITVDCGFPILALITARSAEEMHLEIDTPICASFKASSIHLIPRH